MRFWLVAILCAGLCAGASPEIAGCPVFTAANIWNTPVDKLPVAPSSAAHMAANAEKPLHPDFGSDPNTGIPFDIISHGATVRRSPIRFEYRDESDKVIYPIPANPTIENGANSTGDRHVLIVDKTDCMLYEIFSYQPPAAAGQPLKGGGGAVFNLRSDHLRPESWTSADAGGLPVLPGLVRYEEVAAGEIRHALRFTLPQSLNSYVWPARHFASRLTGPQYMPMGTRLRLKASVDISGFSPANQVILTALKKYGMMLADNGSPWFLSGAPNARWNDTDLGNLKSLHGSDFEEVDVSPFIAAPDSAETTMGAERLSR
jgi:hypothetical protein